MKNAKAYSNPCQNTRSWRPGNPSDDPKFLVIRASRTTDRRINSIPSVTSSAEEKNGTAKNTVVIQYSGTTLGFRLLGDRSSSLVQSNHRCPKENKSNFLQMTFLTAINDCQNKVQGLCCIVEHRRQSQLHEQPFDFACLSRSCCPVKEPSFVSSI